MASVKCGICKRDRSTHTFKEKRLVGQVGGEHDFKTTKQVRDEQQEANFQRMLEQARKDRRS